MDFGLNLVTFNIHEYKNKFEVSNSFNTYRFPILNRKTRGEDVFNSWLKTDIISSKAIFLLVGSTLIFIMIFKILLSIHEYFQNFEIIETIDSHVLSLCISAYRVFFADSLTRLPQSFSMRIILFGWIVYCFFITSEITAKLLSSLVKPDEFDDIQTLDELFDANLTVIVPLTVETIYEENMRPELWNKLSPQLKSDETLKNFLVLAAERRSGILFSVVDDIASYIVYSNIDKTTNEPVYYELKDNLLLLPGIYVFEKGSPFLNRFNSLFGQLHQSGFFQYWRQFAQFNVSLVSGYSNDQLIDSEEESQQVVIQLNNLTEVFIIWALGICAAFFVLLMECLWKKRELLNHSKKLGKWASE